MFQKKQNSFSKQHVVVSAESASSKRSEKKLTQQPAADRSRPGLFKAVAKLDRRRPAGISPNSRQSRPTPARLPSSHLQERVLPVTDSSSPVFAGIDVSSEKLDLGILPSRRTSSFAYDDSGIAALCSELSTLKPALIVIEASGGYQRRIGSALMQAGLSVSIVNPRQVRDFARGIGQLAKTDSVDALVLARFAQQVQPRIQPLPSKEEQLLQELVARRQQLTIMRTAETNRLKQAVGKPARRSIEAVIAVLDKELSKIDTGLDDIIQSNERWKQIDAILQSIPGVGPATSHQLIALLPELGSLSRQEVAALAGLAPYAHESGKFKGQRSIWGGRASVRCALYMAAVTARRCNPIIKPFSQRLEALHKPFKVVITACMRKLLILINALVKSNSAWSPKCTAQNA